MALYCIVTDLTRDTPCSLVIHYAMRESATTPETVRESGTFSYPLDTTLTLADNKAALVAMVNDYFDARIAVATSLDTNFAGFKTQAIGYRRPAQ